MGGRGVRVSAGPLCGPSPNSGYKLAWPPPSVSCRPLILPTSVGRKFLPPPRVEVLTVPGLILGSDLPASVGRRAAPAPSGGVAPGGHLIKRVFLG